MKKNLFIIFLLLIAGVGFIFYKERNLQHPLEKVSIRFNWVHNAQFTGMYVAKEKGFYQDEGLDVNLKQFEDGLDQGKELADQKVTFTDFTAVELLSSIAKGERLKAIAAIYQTSPLVFISLKTTNIVSPKDFKGKILGAKGGNFQAKLIYQTIANNYGVLPSNYTLKDLDFSVDEGDDIVQKRADMVDIYRTDQIYFLDQRHISYNVLYPENFGYQTYGDIIATSQDEIANNPDQVRRFVRATQKGWAYALANMPEALAITKKYEDKLYNDPMHEAYILSHSAPLIMPTGGQAIGAMNIITWTNAINAMKAEGVIQTSIDTADVYTAQFLARTSK